MTNLLLFICIAIISWSIGKTIEKRSNYMMGGMAIYVFIPVVQTIVLLFSFLLFFGWMNGLCLISFLPMLKPIRLYQTHK